MLVLDEERIETWERTREAMEKLAGKTLTEIEVFDLTCAESLCTHDLTPPLGDPEAPMGGYVAKVIERDGFRCQRPGCSNRSALTGSHVKSRGRGGSEDPENILTQRRHPIPIPRFPPATPYSMGTLDDTGLPLGAFSAFPTWIRRQIHLSRASIPLRRNLNRRNRAPPSNRHTCAAPPGSVPLAFSAAAL